VFPYYTNAATDYAWYYVNYSFDKWIGFLRDCLLVTEQADNICITHRGREFLKFVVNEGKNVMYKSL